MILRGQTCMQLHRRGVGSQRLVWPYSLWVAAQVRGKNVTQGWGSGDDGGTKKLDERHGSSLEQLNTWLVCLLEWPWAPANVGHL